MSACLMVLPLFFTSLTVTHGSLRRCWTGLTAPIQHTFTSICFQINSYFHVCCLGSEQKWGWKNREVVFSFINSYYKKCHNTGLELHLFLYSSVEWKAGENTSGAAKREVNIVLTHILKKVKIWLKSKLVLLGCVTSWHISSISPFPAWICFCKTLHTWVLSLNMTGWLEDLADLEPIHVTKPQHCHETSWVSGDVGSSDLKTSFSVAFTLFYLF